MKIYRYWWIHMFSLVSLDNDALAYKINKDFLLNYINSWSSTATELNYQNKIIMLSQ